MDDARYRTLRAMLASALISATLTLPVSGAQAQMSDMKKDAGDDDSEMSDTKKTKTADATGTITALNAANHKITFDHGPIPPIMVRSRHRLAGNEDGIRGRLRLILRS